MEEKDTLISVIVPIYKVEKFLRRCIDSIVEQTYTNLEIILVDDGSPDACPKICDEYSAKDDRIIVIHKKNGGVSNARNTALDIASGIYVILIDSDDYIASTMIEELFHAIIRDASDMALCYFQAVDEFDVRLNNYSMPRKFVDGTVWDENEFWNENIVKRNAITTVPWNKIYKKDIFESVRYADGKTAESESIIHKIVQQCRKITVVPHKLYYYRIRNDSITNSMSRNICFDKLDAYVLRYNYFLKSKQFAFLVPTQKILKDLLICEYKKTKICGTLEDRKLFKRKKKELNKVLDLFDDSLISLSRKSRLDNFLFKKNLFFYLKIHRLFAFLKKNIIKKRCLTSIS